MKNLLLSLATTGLALALAAPVFAQTGTAGVTDPGAAAGKLVGAPVYDDHGQRVGAVLGVLAKNQAGEPTAVLSLNPNLARGTRLVAVPLRDVNFDYTTGTEGAGKPAVSGVSGGDNNWLAGGGG